MTEQCILVWFQRSKTIQYNWPDLDLSHFVFKYRYFISIKVVPHRTNWHKMTHHWSRFGFFTNVFDIPQWRVSICHDNNFQIQCFTRLHRQSPLSSTSATNNTPVNKYYSTQRTIDSQRTKELDALYATHFRHIKTNLNQFLMGECRLEIFGVTLDTLPTFIFVFPLSKIYKFQLSPYLK